MLLNVQFFARICSVNGIFVFWVKKFSELNIYLLSFVFFFFFPFFRLSCFSNVSNVVASRSGESVVVVTK